MATLEGTYWSTKTLEGGDVNPLKRVVLLFNVAGTYVQADNAKLTNVPGMLRTARQNAKTPTILYASLYQLAEKASDRGKFMGLKTVAVAGSDITFEITDSATVGTVDLTTELAAGAVPEQSAPFGLLITFTEA